MSTSSKNYVKHYIGGAKMTGNYGIIKICLPVEKLDEFIETHSKTYSGKQLLFLEVAPRRESDKNGNTHNCYVNELIIEAATEKIEIDGEKVEIIPVPEKKKRASKK
jgi:hypothetical protein